MTKKTNAVGAHTQEGSSVERLGGDDDRSYAFIFDLSQKNMIYWPNNNSRKNKYDQGLSFEAGPFDFFTQIYSI